MDNSRNSSPRMNWSAAFASSCRRMRDSAIQVFTVRTISRLLLLSADEASAVHNGAAASLSFRFTILITELLMFIATFKPTVVLLARRVELSNQPEQLVGHTESGAPKEL